MGKKYIGVMTLTFLGHISHVTIRIAMGRFLFVGHFTQVSILIRFRNFLRYPY